MDAVMAKKKDEPAPSGGRRTAPVQVMKDIARMIAVVATHDGVSQADLVDPWIRQRAIMEYKRVSREMGREIEGLSEPD